MAEYDALADLFLGEGGPAIASASVPAPALRTLKLTPPEPSSSGPAPVASGRAARAIGSLGDGPRVVEPPTGFEAVALGHLPVMASAWAMQYARSVATTRSVPVAMLRVGGGKVSLELIGQDAPGGDGPADTLADAVRRAVGVAGAWLLRVDEPSETELSDVPGVSGITLLTGADEVAIVNSYRAIKGYMEIGLIGRAGDEDAPKVVLRLAVMGSPEDRAKDAANRIRKAAATYLGCAIESVICSPKISPVATHTLFRGEAEAGVREVVAGVIEAWGMPRDVTPADVAETAVIAPSPAPAPPGEAEDADAIADIVVASIIEEADVPAALPEPEIAVPAVRSEPPAVRTQDVILPVESSGSRIGPRTSPTGAGNTAQQLVAHLAGLSSLNIRCPFAPGAELACAFDGTLHVIGMAGLSGDAPRVVEALLAAASWADLHAEVLRQIRPGLRAGQGKTVLHLLTERAKDVRPLIDSEIRLHAIVRGPGGTSTIADLN
jgi:hypothetical protein